MEIIKTKLDVPMYFVPMYQNRARPTACLIWYIGTSSFVLIISICTQPMTRNQLHAANCAITMTKNNKAPRKGGLFQVSRVRPSRGNGNLPSNAQILQRQAARPSRKRARTRRLQPFRGVNSQQRTSSSRWSCVYSSMMYSSTTAMACSGCMSG